MTFGGGCMTPRAGTAVSATPHSTRSRGPGKNVRARRGDAEDEQARDRGGADVELRPDRSASAMVNTADQATG